MNRRESTRSGAPTTRISVEGGRFADDPLDRIENSAEQGLLMEEVFVGIGGEAQFGKEGKDGLLPGRLPGKADGLLGIEPGIGDLYRGDADRGPDEAMAVEIEKWIDFFMFHGYSFSTQA